MVDFFTIILFMVPPRWAGTVWNMQGPGPSFFFFRFHSSKFPFWSFFMFVFCKTQKRYGASVFCLLYPFCFYCVASCDGFFPLLSLLLGTLALVAFFRFIGRLYYISMVSFLDFLIEVGFFVGGGASMTKPGLYTNE